MATPSLPGTKEPQLTPTDADASALGCGGHLFRGHALLLSNTESVCAGQPAFAQPCPDSNHQGPVVLVHVIPVLGAFAEPPVTLEPQVVVGEDDFVAQDAHRLVESSLVRVGHVQVGGAELAH